MLTEALKPDAAELKYESGDANAGNLMSERNLLEMGLSQSMPPSLTTNMIPEIKNKMKKND